MLPRIRFSCGWVAFVCLHALQIAPAQPTATQPVQPRHITLTVTACDLKLGHSTDVGPGGIIYHAHSYVGCSGRTADGKDLVVWWNEPEQGYYPSRFEKGQRYVIGYEGEVGTGVGSWQGPALHLSQIRSCRPSAAPAGCDLLPERALLNAWLVAAAREDWSHQARFDVKFVADKWVVAVWGPPKADPKGGDATSRHVVTISRTGDRVAYDDRIQEDIQPWSEDNEVYLLVEPLPFDRSKLGSTRFRVTLTNTSKKDLIFDRELVTGINVRISSDDPLAKERGQDRVVREEGKDLPVPPKDAWKARFVALKPGQSLTRDFDVSKPFRYVYQGHGTDMEGVHHGFYSEQTARLTVPADAPRIFVQVWYDRAVWMMARPQFIDWHGKNPEEIGVWNGRARSNLLRIGK